MRTADQAFAAYYAAMPDEDLLRAAANRDSLVRVAQAALDAAFQKRGQPAPIQIEAKRSSGSSFWPRIFDEVSAKNAAATGAICSFIIAAITGLFAIVSIFATTTYAGPGSLVDASLFVLLGFMIKRKASRVAAVTAVVAFISDRIYAGFKHGLGAAIGVLAILLLLGLISGVRGTFAYQASRKPLDSSKKTITP